MIDQDIDLVIEIDEIHGIVTTTASVIVEEEAIVGIIANETGGGILLTTRTRIATGKVVKMIIAVDPETNVRETAPTPIFAKMTVATIMKNEGGYLTLVATIARENVFLDSLGHLKYIRLITF